MDLREILPLLETEDKGFEKDEAERVLGNAKNSMKDNSNRGYDWRKTAAKKLYEEDQLTITEIYEEVQKEGSNITRETLVNGLLRMKQFDVIEKVDEHPTTYSMTSVGYEVTEDLCGLED